MYFHMQRRELIDQTFNDFRGTYKQNNNLDDNLYIFSKPHTHMYVTAYNMFLDNKFLELVLDNLEINVKIIVSVNILVKHILIIPT